jgi:Tol biopolymer transport system component
LTLTAIDAELTALAPYLAQAAATPVIQPTATPTPLVVALLPTATPTAAPATVPPTATPIAEEASTATPIADEPAAPAQPLAIDGLRGRIAYSVFNGRAMDIYVYNLADGSRWPHLPNRRQPDFNRGGSYLLANGEGGDVNDVVRITLTGGEQGTTMHPEDAFPQWSPSGQSLAYASTHQGDGKYRIYWQRDASDHTDAPPLAYSGRELFGQYPVYLDNWRIAYQGCNMWAGGSACGIYTADTNGGEPNRATDQTGDIPSDSFGNAILFSSNRDSNWDVYRVNWDGSGFIRLTDHPGRDGLATASPDLQHIAFLSDREGSWAVYVMNTDGSSQQKLFDLNGGYGGGEYDWYRERLSWGP